MADKPQPPQAAQAPEAAGESKRFVDRDVVSIEFLIDDIVKQLVPQGGVSPVAACNGCKGCKSVVDLPNVDLPSTPRGR